MSLASDVAAAAKRAGQTIGEAVAAEARKGPLDYRLAMFRLDVVGSKAYDAQIAEAVTRAELLLSIEGSSELTIEVEDPDGDLVRSGILQRWAWGTGGYLDEAAWIRKGQAVDAKLDDLYFRLAGVSKSGTQLTFTLEDREVSYLRLHKGAVKANRKRSTRAEFAKRLVKEVKAHGGIEFYSPELHKRQSVAKAPRPTAAERAQTLSPGIDSGAALTVKGKHATATQIKLAETALDVADALKAPPLAVLAMMCSAIGESNITDVVNSLGYGGVFQGQVKVRNGANYFAGMSARKRTSEEAHYFLMGGKGYNQGGAIHLARTQPHLSPGTIATMVETSGKPGSFYDEHRAEAAAFIRAYGGNSADAIGIGSYYKRYEFRRGKRENSWDALQRLADEVGWRCFMRKGTVYFASEEDLFRQKAALDVSADDVDTCDWDLDTRTAALVSEVRITAHAARWTALPGQVAIVRNEGPASGRWLVTEVRRDLLDDASTVEVTLRKPMPDKPEPRAEKAQRERDAAVGQLGTNGGAKGIVEQLVKIAKDAGGSTVYVGSSFRANSTTTSGNLSDHASNDRGRAARDIGVRGIDLLVGPPSPRLDKACEAIVEALGGTYKPGTRIVENFTFHGYRVQVIWRTPEYGGHMGHVHVGARKL